DSLKPAGSDRNVTQFEGAALGPAAGLAQFVEFHGVYGVAKGAQAFGQAGGLGGQDDVVAVADGVQSQDHGVVLGGEQRVGVQRAQDPSAPGGESPWIVDDLLPRQRE